MDEETEKLAINSPWEIQILSDSDFVFRQVHISQRDDKKNPRESHFALRENEQDLSFNLKGIVDVERNYKLIGITYNKNQKFLDPTHFRLFEFPVDFLKTLVGFEKIVHTPNFTNAPSAIGRPNNKAHVSLCCGDFKERTRVQLRDYCRESDSECHYNISSILKDIEELKLRNNETPFHYYWEFEN